MNVGQSFSIAQDNHLTLNGVDLVDLCTHYGTPLFVFSEDCLVRNFKRFHQAFEKNFSNIMICYSVKTNNNSAICSILRKNGAYAEVASELDLHAAEKAGFGGDHIVFDGPYKSKTVLRKALEKELLLINVESFAEIERLDTLASEMGVKQAVGLRINPFKSPNPFASIHPRNLFHAAYCHPRCRFGFPLEEGYLALEQTLKSKNLMLEGLAVHPYREALKVLIPIMKNVRERFGTEIKYLNVGGGFNPGVTKITDFRTLFLDSIRQKLGFKSVLDEKKNVRDIETIAKSMAKEFKQEMENLSEPIIVAEPGRFIVASSGILLLRVDHVKTAGSFKWVTVDGGTNIVPSIHERHRILIANKATNPPKEAANIVGPLLYPNDFIAMKTLIPEIEEGDIVSVFDCGAYTLSSSNQFLYPRPPALLLNSKGEATVIREKETTEDVLRKDRLPNP